MGSGFNTLRAGATRVGPPGEIRTPDTQVRSLVLYPAELRAEGVKNRQTQLVSQGITRQRGVDIGPAKRNRLAE